MKHSVDLTVRVGEVLKSIEIASDTLSMEELLAIGNAWINSNGDEMKFPTSVTIINNTTNVPEPVFTPTSSLDEAVAALQKLQNENNLLQTANKLLAEEKSGLQHRVEEYQRRLKVIRDHA